MAEIKKTVSEAASKYADLKPGMTVRIYQKIKELNTKGEEKERVQYFEGMIIARKHNKEKGATITVRKVASGVGVERIFPLYSPMIDKIEIVKNSTVRRAKLYYVRERAVRDVRRKMKQTRMSGASTKDFESAPVVAEATPEVAAE